MREITIKVYKFEELSVEDQEKVVSKLADINVDYQWWQYTYDDASGVGLIIQAFDGHAVTAVFSDYALLTAEAIIKEHGEDCATYESAKAYLTDWQTLKAEQAQEDADMFCEPGNSAWYEAYCEQTAEIDTEDIDNDFLRALCEDYRVILQKEYEYLTSDEAVRDTIMCNEWEFPEGTLKLM